MDSRIVIDQSICHGKPVIRGSRVPVVIVLGSLAGGMSFEEIQEEYALEREDILAALRFAEGIIDNDQFFSLAT